MKLFKIKYLLVLFFLFSVFIVKSINKNDSINENMFDTVINYNVNNNVQELIDSLNFTTESKTRSIYGIIIARKLKDIDWVRSTKYIDIAEDNALKTDNKLFIINIYKQIADIYYSKDFLDISLEYYVKAYKSFNEGVGSELYHNLENDIAIIAAKLNQKDKALEFFKRVYNFQTLNNDSLGIAKVYNNIGLLLINTNVDSSIYYFNKGLYLSDRLSNKILNTHIYTNLARCYSIKNDVIKTDLFNKKALESLSNTDNKTKSWVFLSISTDLLKRDLLDSSIYYAKKSLQLLDLDKYSFAYKDVTRILYKCYLKKGNFEKSSKYFIIYDNIRDSLNIEKKAVNAERIKLEQEYLIKDRIRTAEENNRQSKYLILGFSLLLILLLLMIILIKFKSKLIESKLKNDLIESKKEKLNIELESKNKVLIAKAMKEIHRTELTQAILEDLKEIKVKAVKRETQTALSIIQKRIENDANSNVWEEFEISFEQVHETFYNNLGKMHPSLTSKDKRLCALLVLNLTSKEISQITGQDFKSVENSRTRLRKKLDLTNTKADLTSYLDELK